MNTPLPQKRFCKVGDLVSQKWFSWEELCAFCKMCGIPTVKVVWCMEAEELSVDFVQCLADNLKYDTGKAAEGVVFRPNNPVHSNVLGKSWLSIKAINQNYKD